MVNFKDPSQYKKCRKKLYDIHVCMPPIGTVVINKLEQFDVVQQLGGRTYFTLAELQEMQSSNQAMFNMITQLVQAGKAYNVNENNRFVLAGTVGEMWTVKPAKLQSGYVFTDDDKTVQINQELLNKKLKNGCLPWTRIRTVPDNSVAHACFVPANQQAQVQTSWGAVLNVNGVGVSHGKGDFVISADANGKPDLSNQWVVNGEVFARTYDNHGWTQFLAPQVNVKPIEIKDLPNLCPSAGENSSIEFKNFINSLKTAYASRGVGLKEVVNGSDYGFILGNPNTVLIKVGLVNTEKRWVVKNAVLKVRSDLAPHTEISGKIKTALSNECKSLESLYNLLISENFMLWFSSSVNSRLEDYFHVEDPDEERGFEAMGEFVLSMMHYIMVTQTSKANELISTFNSMHMIYDGIVCCDVVQDGILAIANNPKVVTSGITARMNNQEVCKGSIVGVTRDGKKFGFEVQGTTITRLPNNTPFPLDWDTYMEEGTEYVTKKIVDMLGLGGSSSLVSDFTAKVSELGNPHGVSGVVKNTSDDYGEVYFELNQHFYFTVCVELGDESRVFISAGSHNDLSQYNEELYENCAWNTGFEKEFNKNSANVDTLVSWTNNILSRLIEEASPFRQLCNFDFSAKNMTPEQCKDGVAARLITIFLNDFGRTAYNKINHCWLAISRLSKEFSSYFEDFCIYPDREVENLCFSYEASQGYCDQYIYGYYSHYGNSGALATWLDDYDDPIELSNSSPFSEAAIGKYVAHDIFEVYTSGLADDEIAEEITTLKAKLSLVGVEEDEATKLAELLISNECWEDEFKYCTPTLPLQSLGSLLDTMAYMKSTRIPSLSISTRCDDAFDVGLNYSMTIDDTKLYGIFNLRSEKNCEVMWGICIWLEGMEDEDPTEFDYTADELEGIRFYQEFKNTMIPQCS